MKGSPARARVVYAPVLEVGGEGRLVRACSILWNFFIADKQYVYCCHLSVLWDFLTNSLSVSFIIISVSILLLFIKLNHPMQCCFLTDTFLEVITEAFAKSGLVLERDARQELRVSITV